MSSSTQPGAAADAAQSADDDNPATNLPIAANGNLPLAEEQLQALVREAKARFLEAAVESAKRVWDQEIGSALSRIAMFQDRNHAMKITCNAVAQAVWRDVYDEQNGSAYILFDAVENVWESTSPNMEAQDAGAR